MPENSKFDRARAEIEGEDKAVSSRSDKTMPPAGPHARTDSTNEDATPGTGSLPSVEPGNDVDAGTGR